jgi:hypothetical protein
MLQRATASYRELGATEFKLILKHATAYIDVA